MTEQAQPRLLLDAGALVDVDKHPRGKLIVKCRAETMRGRRPLLPAVVLAQVWRGSARQHGLARLRSWCEVLPFGEAMADAVGRLLARSRTVDVVDAAVVLTAVRYNAVVLTSDADDIRHLARSMNLAVAVTPV